MIDEVILFLAEIAKTAERFTIFSLRTQRSLRERFLLFFRNVKRRQ